MKWAGLETPKLVAVHQRVKVVCMVHRYPNLVTTSLVTKLIVWYKIGYTTYTCLFIINVVQ